MNGPYSLIMTAVSVDLAKKVKTSAALATVCAIINGTGSLGAAVGPGLVGYLYEYGWAYIFHMIVLSNLLAVLSLLRVGYYDIKTLRSVRKEREKGKHFDNCISKL